MNEYQYDDAEIGVQHDTTPKDSDHELVELPTAANPPPLPPGILMEARAGYCKGCCAYVCPDYCNHLQRPLHHGARHEDCPLGRGRLQSATWASEEPPERLVKIDVRVA